MDGETKTNPSTPYHQRETVKHVVYESADKVSGKLSMRAGGGKKEISGAVQGEEYDDIKTCGVSATTVYDDVETCKMSADVKASNTSALYDDIQTSNASALYDDVKIPGTSALYDDVKTSKSLPSTNVEYDDVKTISMTSGLYDDVKASKSLLSSADNEYDDVKESGKALAKTAAKPNNSNPFTYSGQEEQPFDNEMYNAPFSPLPSGASFMAYANDSCYVNTNS